MSYSENEIKTGVALLDYVEKIMKISLNLGNAVTEVYTAKTTLETAYIGEAKEEMEQYLYSFDAHLQKMITLYSSLSSYIYGVYDKMEAKDAALSRWVLANWGVEVEVEDGQIRTKEG